MRIDWIIPAISVEVLDGLANITGAGADTYCVPAFPAEVMLAMAVRLTGPVVPGPTEVTFTSRVLGTDMEPVTSDLEAVFEFTPKPSAEPDAEGQFIFAASHRFTASGPGLYTVVMDANGRSETVCVRVELQ